jgi:flagellar hook protein FlgE
MGIFGVALGGMAGAEARLETTAKRLAGVADPADTVDLSAEMVALMESRNTFAANANVLKTADEMERKALDVLA